MRNSHRQKLANIRDLDQLIPYLREEMGWPIQDDDFEDIEDLFYDFTPEELGIDEQNSAKIEEIRRLRPLSASQPWGIFFVRFEPKKLPVVALRRILSKITLKNRSSANDSEKVAWNTNDLLFVSNYGEGDSRHICFAHFTEDKQTSNLATLQVLGWDKQDTALHIDDVVETLSAKLKWPDDEDDVENWREQWSSAFTLRNREVITTSKELAVQLAKLATDIRSTVLTAIKIESPKGKLRTLMQEFKSSLIHDLTEEDFADTYAQTIAYGLLSARVSRQSGALVSDDAALMVPATNPFLQELMETFLNIRGRSQNQDDLLLDFDELGIVQVVETLRNANMEAVLRDFGDKNPMEDPVIHFYELFLTEYDPELRLKRGVFYTPRPVVTFIVRSVDVLLRNEFGLADGLADTTTWAEMIEKRPEIKIPEGVEPDSAFIQILDPATGTGTFLVEAIDLIYQTMNEKWQREGLTENEIESHWNDYVSEHLLTRIYGYELLMAPYTIAHMKIGLKLAETGYRFKTDQRLRVYLTNALEPARDTEGTFAFYLTALAKEAEAVSHVKREKRFTVVIGNPPYSGHSQNQSRNKDRSFTTIGRLIEDYKEIDGVSLGERNPKWLQDDYVKFLRFSENTISAIGSGVLSYITNHGYLDNPTFRGMRHHLIGTFNRLQFLDLHGNVKKGTMKVDSDTDQNVFDIQQGVAICLLTRLKATDEINVRKSDLKGDRIFKYKFLLENTFESLTSSCPKPQSPDYAFEDQSFSIRNEFMGFVPITEIFPIKSVGVTTGRDMLCVSYTAEEAVGKLHEFAHCDSVDRIKVEYNLSNKSGWNIQKARNQVLDTDISQEKCVPFAYRPFDLRVLYADDIIVGRLRYDVMKNMVHENLGIVTTRKTNGQFKHVFCSSNIINDCFVSTNSGERSYIFPLYLFDTVADGHYSDRRRFNISESFLERIMAILNGPKVPNDNEMEATHTQIFNFIYAVLHSKKYRNRYSAFLQYSYPHIPIPKSCSCFNDLAMLGSSLSSLHLLKTDVPIITQLIGSLSHEVEKVSYSDSTVWIDKAQTQGFQGVPKAVWNFHIGGYQVCEKWLKDRQAKGGKNPKPGRVLTDEDIQHYQKIVVAIKETIRLMAEIDKVIEKHGGWPGAFQG